MGTAIHNLANSLDDQQHIVLEDISWGFYQRLLKEIGDRQTRITYYDGRLEIMSPICAHERYGAWITSLIKLISFDREICCVGAGSGTLNDPTSKTGLEPDECFYIQNANAAHKINGRFNPKIHFPPDLAIELDIVHRWIDRLPIYTALRVREIWRFDGKRLHVLHLSRGGKYSLKPKSLAFPFLPMTEFETFISRVTELNRNAVLTEFRHWLAKLPKSKQS